MIYMYISCVWRYATSCKYVSPHTYIYNFQFGFKLFVGYPGKHDTRIKYRAGNSKNSSADDRATKDN